MWREITFSATIVPVKSFSISVIATYQDAGLTRSRINERDKRHFLKSTGYQEIPDSKKIQVPWGCEVGSLKGSLKHDHYGESVSKWVSEMRMRMRMRVRVRMWTSLSGGSSSRIECDVGFMKKNMNWCIQKYSQPRVSRIRITRILG